MNKTASLNHKSEEGWAHHEFEGIALGDTRLERRLIDVAGDLLGSPTAPITHACEDAASMKAAYRLFDNDKISSRAMLAPHQENTINSSTRRL